MTDHTLQGRTASELHWFRRRRFLQAAAGWVSLGGIATAKAQGRSNVVELNGDAMLNGARLRSDQTIQPGDTLRTGPGTRLTFVIGSDAFHVRQNSQLQLEPGSSGAVVGVLRLLTGAVVSVWGKGPERKIITSTLTAGIRGTGVYTEVLPEPDGRHYLCNCYGLIQVSASTEQIESRAEYHQAFWAAPTSRDGRSLTPAPAINHTDEELEYLAQLVDQRTAWQISGQKGAKDSSSYGGYGSSGSSDPSDYGKSRP
jgi:hypothetical protein